MAGLLHYEASIQGTLICFLRWYSSVPVLSWTWVGTGDKKKIHTCLKCLFLLEGYIVTFTCQACCRAWTFYRGAGVGCEHAWNSPQPGAQSHPHWPGDEMETGSLVRSSPPLTASVSTTFMFRDWPFGRFAAWFLVSAFTDQWLCWYLIQLCNYSIRYDW